jgi:hypothetical protein
MLDRRRLTVRLALIAAVLLAGCASPRGIVPDHPRERYSLPSWPRQSISLEVVDARSRKEDSARLVEVTTAVLAEALAAASAPPGPPRELFVEIMVHDVSLQGPMWIATTRFRAMLIEAGRTLRTWDARGEQRRVNWLPADARTAAQEAYERGLSGLVNRLQQEPP